MLSTNPTKYIVKYVNHFEIASTTNQLDSFAVTNPKVGGVGEDSVARIRLFVGYSPGSGRGGGDRRECVQAGVRHQQDDWEYEEYQGVARSGRSRRWWRWGWSGTTAIGSSIGRGDCARRNHQCGGHTCHGNGKARWFGGARNFGGLRRCTGYRCGGLGHAHALDVRSRNTEALFTLWRHLFGVVLVLARRIDCIWQRSWWRFNFGVDPSPVPS